MSKSCEVPKELKEFGATLGQVMERVTEIVKVYNTYLRGNTQSKDAVQILCGEVGKLSERLLETGIGDWIRGTKMWDEFQNETSILFSTVIDLIGKEV